ncbi:DNA/RNA non-specific endonuclease [Sphingomonas zeae]
MLRITIGLAIACLLIVFPAAGAQAERCPQLFAGGNAPVLNKPSLAEGTTQLCNRAFAVLHSSRTRTPLWSAEHLTRASVATARNYDQRSNRFHADPRLLPSDRAELSDYVRSGFDRGHMAPSGDMVDAESDYESFSLANIAPQAPSLNRNGWADLEQYVRGLTMTLGETYVVTGSLYEGATIKTLKGRVLIPTSYWKAVWSRGQGAGAWIATNAAKPVWQVVSIAELTRRTGVDPFPQLDRATRTKVPAFPTFDRTKSSRRSRP